MSFAQPLSSNFSINLKRYIRSPGLLLTALAVPIAAHYMVPDKDASYAVLTINGAKPELTAPVLGLELGVLAATLLTPLAYIFLRAGPTRHRPWQISDVAPHSRIMTSLGRWVADTAALWMLLVALTIAGLIIGLFRLQGPSDIFQTSVALWLPAAPALALVAAIRIVLDARNMTRGWLGDVIFFFAWVFLMVMGIVGSSDPQSGLMVARPLTDAFGFTAPVVNSVDYPVNAVTIGGATARLDSVPINAWQSVTDTAYIGARLVWLAISMSLVVFAGLVWGPMKTRLPKLSKRAAQLAAMPRVSMSDTVFKAPAAVKALRGIHVPAVLFSEIKLMLKSKAWLLFLGVAAIMGAILPFRTMAGPAILLALIFPLTEASSRWQAKSTGQYLETLGTNANLRTGLLYVASISVALAVMLPVLLRTIAAGEFQWLPHIGMIVFAAPALIIAAGRLTRSAVAGRMIMLIIWYVYLSSGSL